MSEDLVKYETKYFLKKYKLNDLIQNPDLINEVQLEIQGIEQLEKEGVLHHVVETFVKAKAIDKMNKLFNDGVVKFIKSTLENSRIGFKTDKSPGGYPLDVLRTCIIESMFFGLHVTGNEFNIIAGNMYPTKEGLYNKAVREERFTKKPVIEFNVPQMDLKEKVGRVKYTAKWAWDGKEETIVSEKAIELTVKSYNGNLVNYTGIDAVLGKAKRRIYADIWERCIGSSVTSGDVDDTQPEILEAEIVDDAEISTGSSPELSEDQKKELFGKEEKPDDTPEEKVDEKNNSETIFPEDKKGKKDVGSYLD